MLPNCRRLLAVFKALTAEHTVFAPHLPLYAGSEEVTNAWLEKYAGRLQNVYNKLADGQSRKVFANVLNYKLSGRLNICGSAKRIEQKI